MSSLLLVVLCLVTGAWLTRTGRVPDSTPGAISSLLIELGLPALILSTLLHMTPPARAWVPLTAGWLQFGLALAIFPVLGRLLGLKRATVACLIIVAGLGNTSFVGYPVLEAFLGKQALAVGVLVDQGGSFPLLSTGAGLVAAWGSGQARSLPALLRKAASFPPFLATALGLGLRVLGVDATLLSAGWGAGFLMALDRLGSLVIPLALLSVGMRLTLPRSLSGPLGLGLAFKLGLSPLVAWGVYRALGVPLDLTLQATLVEVAVPPMITAGLVARDAGLDPELADGLVGLGLLGSALTLPLWALLWGVRF